MSMSNRSFDHLIPVPEKSVYTDGEFFISKMESVSFPKAAKDAFTILKRSCKVLKISLEETQNDSANVIFQTDEKIKQDAWKIEITPEKIFLIASGKNGFFYAVGAFVQILVSALIKGRINSAVINCGYVEDSPRFEWRGFMLDSARHFQSAETIKKLLLIFSAFRINSFHWHLSDKQAWRWNAKLIPGITEKGEYEDGCYTQKELHEIAELAERLGIRLIPEVDVPGHSRKLLSHRPDLACDSSNPGCEICLGNPKTLPFLKELFTELIETFPHSKIIHLGGDEAATDAWEKCPQCQSAMKKLALSSPRQLENHFMNELTQFILLQGRTPMMWGTCSGQKYDPRTIMQAWLDIREPIRLAQDGNKVVYSVHNSFYFDYPADLSEPHETWMFELSERGIYMADPYIIWADRVKDSILGTEACLWTERVPEWRVMQKILPRIFAYSECSWSVPERKEYNDFVRRRKHLESAGYLEILRNAFSECFIADF